MIPAQIQRTHIISAIEYVKRNGCPKKNKSTKHDLLYEGERYPPKYIVSIAHRFIDGVDWDLSGFSGGSETNGFLEKRQFVITAKIEPPEESYSGRGEIWSKQEVKEAVESYTRMLKQELRGQKYVKLNYIDELRKKLHRRTKGAIEFKYENISAVLSELGLKFIDGYKPASNYQRALKAEVIRYLSDYQELKSILAPDADRAPLRVPTVDDTGSVFVEVPAKRPTKDSTSQGMGGRVRTNIDYGKRCHAPTKDTSS